MLCFSPIHRSENERECGAAGEIRPRIGLEGAADRPERVDPGRSKEPEVNSQKFFNKMLDFRHRV